MIARSSRGPVRRTRRNTGLTFCLNGPFRGFEADVQTTDRPGPRLPGMARHVHPQRRRNSTVMSRKVGSSTAQDHPM